METDQIIASSSGAGSASSKNIRQVGDIIQEEYGRVPQRLKVLFDDLVRLYAGLWDTHEACQVRYHNLDHALDVALAAARMAAGWNRAGEQPPISDDLFCCGVAAALFHDAGYIKDKGDHEGEGGKFTFTHVERGMAMARDYLQAAGWPAGQVELIPRIISVTDYRANVDLDRLFATEPERNLARIVASSDLLAQMADTDYLHRINDLFAEFQEVYEYESPESLHRQGARVFKSAQEVVDGTIAFYEKIVVPYLQRFNRMDRYLNIYFGNGRNPYLENIAANLSSRLMDGGDHWRRLGDILQELGLVPAGKIEEALARQVKGEAKGEPAEPGARARLIRKRLLPWFDSRYGCNCLGEILVSMDAISPAALADGLLSQVMPDALCRRLSRDELLFFLRVSGLLHNLCKGPWVLDRIMEMANQALSCEASSLLVAGPDSEEILVSVPTGPSRHLLQGKMIPVDKGLAGWVYRNGRPARVPNTDIDDRFRHDTDRNSGLESRSILAVPLFVNGECIGVLEAINKSDDNFTEHDMDILTMLSNLISLALDGLLFLKESGPS